MRATIFNKLCHPKIRSELKRFDSGVKGALREIDPETYQRERISYLDNLVECRSNHLQAALGHLSRGRGKQIILVMDNADQRNRDVQQEAFLIAQELAATRNLLVFVALRPSTFYSSKMTGALSGYQNKILTISPPPADEVVLKRLSFAVRVAEGKVAPGTLTNIRLQLGSVTTFLRATLRSVRTNEDIRQFLSNITGGNTRSVIELIIGFVGSPNVNSKKIVRVEERTNNYFVPLHEFTKHALLGEYAYYNQQSSQVACNIFDVCTSDPREHFLCGLLISFLGSNIGIRDGDGYLSGAAILTELKQHGFSEDQILDALRRTSVKRLIETPHAHFRELTVPEQVSPAEFHYRVTSVGIYHVKFWSGDFAFLDAMSIDTPIFDQHIRERAAELAASLNIGDRYQRTYLFRSYLLECWHQANIGVSYYDFGALLEIRKISFEKVKTVVNGNDIQFAKK